MKEKKNRSCETHIYRWDIIAAKYLRLGSNVSRNFSRWDGFISVQLETKKKGRKNH
jgi:hypothetical protein